MRETMIEYESEIREIELEGKLLCGERWNQNLACRILDVETTDETQTDAYE
jgi:hypothetical protein